jgi:hypothetical protein
MSWSILIQAGLAGSFLAALIVEAVLNLRDRRARRRRGDKR